MSTGADPPKLENDSTNETESAGVDESAAVPGPATPERPAQPPAEDEKEAVSATPPSPILSPMERARKIVELGGKLWLLFQQHVGTVVSDDVAFADHNKLIQQTDILNIAARFRHVIACIEQGKRPHKEMKQYHYKNARVLLAASIIHKFPKETLYDGKDVVDDQAKICHQAASSVVKYVYQPSNLVNDKVPCRSDLSRAYRVVKLFDSIFKTWKNKDKDDTVEKLADRYAQLSKSLAALNLLPEDKRFMLTDVLGVLEASLNDVRTKITSFSDRDTLDKIEAETASELTMGASPFPSAPMTPSRLNTNPIAFQLPPSPFKLTPQAQQPDDEKGATPDERSAMEAAQETKMINLDKIIQEESHKLYWKEFRTQLANDDYHRVYQLLQEIRERISKLNAKKESAMEDQVDVDFIKQTIENKAFDLSTFHQLFGGIHAHIKSLQAAADDKNWQAFHDNVLEEAAAGKPLVELLPEVFNRILMQLDRIDDAVAKFRAIQEIRKSGGSTE